MGKIVRVAILPAGLSPRERDRLYLLSSVSSPFHVSAPCLRGRPARGQGRAERDENVSVHCDPLLFVGVRGGLRLGMVHGKPGVGGFESLQARHFSTATYATHPVAWL